MYKHEMTEDDHVELLDVLLKPPGPVLLAGYSNEMCDSGWNLGAVKQEEHRQRLGRYETEVLWIKPVAAEQTCQSFVLNLQIIGAVA